MGGMTALMDKLPAKFAEAAASMPAGSDEKMAKRIQGIIDSMTPDERTKPDLIKASRKRRIAAGAGVQVQEVNRLLNQFEQTQKMMKQFGSMFKGKGGMMKMMRGAKSMFGGKLPF
jgi:signal recognition particle subunit SRP54